ncbi:MAG: hypothetical protein ABH872_06650 [Candidatus Omnitrophota bacterium]
MKKRPFLPRFYKQRVLKKPIGQLLFENNIISQEELDKCLAIQKCKEKSHQKELLGEILIRLGFATEEQVINAVAAQYGIPYIPLDNFKADLKVIKAVPANLVYKYIIFPLDIMDDILTIAISDVPKAETISALRTSLSMDIAVFLTAPAHLRNIIAKYYPNK